MNDEGYVDSCDTMAKIGAEKGEGRSWQILWEADPNKDLGGKRKNPYMLFKGDQFHDDKGKPQIEKGDKVVVDPAELGLAKGSTEKTITSKKKALPKTELRLKIVDGLHKPAKKWKYKLKLGGETFTGQTEDDGTIVVKLKSDEVIAGDLEVTEKRTIAGEDGGETVEEGEQVKFKLHVGKLNPISDAETDIPDKGVSGVQARLHNLEFECGDINGLFNDPTRNATVSFLKRIDVKTTGGDGNILPDDKLLEKARKGLEKHHDQKADFPEVKQPSVKTPPPIPPKPGAKKTPPPIPPRPGTKKTPPPIPPRPGTKKTPPPIPPKPGTKKTPPPVPPKPKKPLGGGQ